YKTVIRELANQIAWPNTLKEGGWRPTGTLAPSQQAQMLGDQALLRAEALVQYPALDNSRHSENTPGPGEEAADADDPAGTNGVQGERPIEDYVEAESASQADHDQERPRDIAPGNSSAPASHQRQRKKV